MTQPEPRPLRPPSAPRLKRRTTSLAGDRFWLIYGPHGVVSWTLVPDFLGGLAGDLFGPIGIHAPKPRPWESESKPVDDCPWLEMPCYFDASYRHGELLGKAWQAAGEDDDVIWTELEGWYDSHLVS